MSRKLQGDGMITKLYWNFILEREIRIYTDGIKLW